MNVADMCSGLMSSSPDKCEPTAPFFRTELADRRRLRGKTTVGRSLGSIGRAGRQLAADAVSYAEAMGCFAAMITRTAA